MRMTLKNPRARLTRIHQPNTALQGARRLAHRYRCGQCWPRSAGREGAVPMPVLVALGSLATTLLGGLAALRIGDRRHLVLGLAAGLMLGVVLFDLLPEALGEQPASLFGVPAVLLAAMAGFLTLHVIERSAPVHRGH